MPIVRERVFPPTEKLITQLFPIRIEAGRIRIIRFGFWMLGKRMNIGGPRLIRCSWYTAMCHASSWIEIFGGTFGPTLLHRTIFRWRHRMAGILLQKKTKLVYFLPIHCECIECQCDILMNDLPMVEYYRLIPNSCAIYHTDRVAHYFSLVPCDDSLRSRRCCHIGPDCCSCPHPENCWTLPLSSWHVRSANQSVGSPNLFLLDVSIENKLIKWNKIKSKLMKRIDATCTKSGWQRQRAKNVMRLLTHLNVFSLTWFLHMKCEVWWSDHRKKKNKVRNKIRICSV